MKSKLIKSLIVVFFLFVNLNTAYTQTNNAIVITVGNQPITRLDLMKEIKLIAISSNVLIVEKNKKQIRDLAIQSLIKRTIKEIEIKRLNVDRYNKEEVKSKILNIANSLGLDERGFNQLLAENGLEFTDLERRFKTELKWNTAIFQLYKNKIYLNTVEIEEKINLELKNVKSEKTFLLSEIAVNLPTEGYEQYVKKIEKQISQEGFEKTAKNLSISKSAEYGGSIGWIEQNKLAKIIYKNIKSLKKGEITNPIILGEKIIFIKKIDEKGGEINIENIKKDIVNAEKMRKLDMFSNSHYSELEKKIQVKFL